MYLIELDNIIKNYKLGETVVKALRGISLKIRKGEYVYITGPSGSGKSTLLHILGFLDSPTKGEYWFNGKRTSLWKEKEKSIVRKHHIGFVFQNFYLLPYFNVYKNVEVALMIRKYPRTHRKNLIEEILNRVGLYEKRFRKPDELSGGERQRVAIARAVVKNPDIILADEPTGNLDTHTGNEIIDLLEGLNSEGKTIVIITHNTEIAKRGHLEVKIRDGVIEEVIERQKLK